MSDKELLLKERFKKQQQVEYCELFDVRSFGREPLKFFQKKGDYSHSWGDGEN